MILARIFVDISSPKQTYVRIPNKLKALELCYGAEENAINCYDFCIRHAKAVRNSREIFKKFRVSLKNKKEQTHTL
jgi:hypothetical protein